MAIHGLKNGKRYEGLSFEGLIAQMASIILLWDYGRQPKMCTANDCQLLVRHALRAYHSLFKRENPHDMYYTIGARIAIDTGHPVHLEHAIPVQAVTVSLMETRARTLNEMVKLISPIVKQSCVFVKVTISEHDMLNEGFAHKMPGNEMYPWKSPWARYESVGLPRPTR